FDPTMYHIYGTRVTTDGNTGISRCNYLDQALLGCTTTFQLTASAPNEYLDRNTYFITFGPLSQAASNNFKNRGDVYVRWVRVWSCSGWRSDSCNGPILTSAP